MADIVERSERRLEILGIILIVIVMFAFGVGGYVFFAACGRKDMDWLDEQAVAKTPFKQLYPAIVLGHQWLQEHPVQDVYTTSHDGLRLHATWVPAENAWGTIVLVHGYQSCVLTDFSIALPLYHEMGLNILLPSQRAHGKSEGKYITFGVHESRDMQQWVQYHNEHFGTLPLVLSGMSMGASTVMYMADAQLPSNVKGFIADCGFSSPHAIIAKVFNSTTRIPAWTVMWSADLFARVFAHFSLFEKDTVKSLAKNTRPIVMVHGEADDFVPCEMTRRGFDACAGDKRLLIVEGASHGVSFLKAKEEYSALVDDLLQRCMQENV